MLKSEQMSLSEAERRWLPWFGKTGKMAMRWATLLNRGRYESVEQTFESIAQTRVRILQSWTDQQWSHLASLVAELAAGFPTIDGEVLMGRIALADDFSELFVLDAAGRLLASTARPTGGDASLPPQALASGMAARFLHGTYCDPSTGELHPGVRETIRKGENLFVTYPGYSDYRHVPVIGKGVTFRLPGSPDVWGMMCEGDLEEVYRYRSVAFRLGQRLQQTSAMLRGIAEGGGDLRQRLRRESEHMDEATETAQSANSFIDNLEQIVRRLIKTTREINQTNRSLQLTTKRSSGASPRMLHETQEILQSLTRQMVEVNAASGTRKPCAKESGVSPRRRRRNSRRCRNAPPVSGRLSMLQQQRYVSSSRAPLKSAAL